MRKRTQRCQAKCQLHTCGTDMYKASWQKTSVPPSLNVRMKAQQKSVSIYHKGVTSLPIFMQNLSGSGRVANTFLGSFPQYRCVYRVVPKGLLASLDSLYKEIPKTTSGTLVYRFERQTARKKYFFLPMFLSQEPSDSFILYFNVIFHGK